MSVMLGGEAQQLVPSVTFQGETILTSKPAQTEKAGWLDHTLSAPVGTLKTQSKFFII